VEQGKGQVFRIVVAIFGDTLTSEVAVAVVLGTAVAVAVDDTDDTHIRKNCFQNEEEDDDDDHTFGEVMAVEVLRHTKVILLLLFAVFYPLQI